MALEFVIMSTNALTHRQLRVPRPVRDLAPSARLVYVLLEAHDTALSQSDVRALSGLSSETTRRALGALQDANVVAERPHDRDGRKQLYVLSERISRPATTPQGGDA